MSRTANGRHDPNSEPEVLRDAQLEQANGGIIAVLIGLAHDPKSPAQETVQLKR